MNHLISSEHREQAALITWASLARGTIPELNHLFAVANGGKRDKITASKLKAEGVSPGVPDLFLAWPAHGAHGLFVEMKRRVGGRLSDAQITWRERLTKCGYRVRVCKGWEEAKEAIITYLKGEEP